MSNACLNGDAVAGACREARNIRQTNRAANASREMTSMLPSAEAKAPQSPQCESVAAIPRPAAMPVIRPGQRLLAAGGVCASVVAAFWVGAFCTGAIGWRFRLGDCRSKLLPPPSRPASASSKTTATPATINNSAASPANPLRRLLQKYYITLSMV